MIEDLSVIAVTYFANILMRDLTFIRRILYIIVAFAVLKFFPGKMKLLLQATLVWNVFELADAFLNLTNYDDEDYKCTYTASISKSEKTADELWETSSLEGGSMSSSSQQPMDASTPLEGSTSAPQSTDVQ
jgi:hypothetical protein